MKKVFFALVVPVIALSPTFAFAASTVSLINPLGETDVRVIFGRVISAALSILGTLALAMFVYGGVLWMTSRGDSKQVTKGKDTVTWAVLGLVIIFASYALVNALLTGITTGVAS